MSKLKRAIETREYRLSITENGETRSYTFLDRTIDGAWVQAFDSIPAIEDATPSTRVVMTEVKR